MLLAKATSDEPEEHIKLPYVFSSHTDIRLTSDPRTPPRYDCSVFSHVWFREHSNLDHIVKDYWELKDHRQKPQSAYTSFVIRTVTSDPGRYKSELLMCGF